MNRLFAYQSLAARGLDREESMLFTRHKSANFYDINGLMSAATTVALHLPSLIASRPHSSITMSKALNILRLDHQIHRQPGLHEARIIVARYAARSPHFIS